MDIIYKGKKLEKILEVFFDVLVIARTIRNKHSRQHNVLSKNLVEKKFITPLSLYIPTLLEKVSKNHNEK
jgi:hypothetical protein